MKEKDYIDQMIREMRIRNYSERTITSYSAFLTKLTNYYQLSLVEFTTDHLKRYLYDRINKDRISVSAINQCISAFKFYNPTFWE